MNPELEKPVRYICCDLCSGHGKMEDDDDDPPISGRVFLTCPDCDGAGYIEIDETDAREDAEEARWEGGRGK